MVVVHETAPSKQLTQLISVDSGECGHEDTRTSDARHDRRLRPLGLEENIG